MGTLKEPYVHVKEAVKNTPALVETDGSSAIACVIVAPCGPALIKINGPKQFVENFTENGEIPVDAHISLINAYYLSFSATLIVARSVNGNVTAGVALTDSTSNASDKPVYIDPETGFVYTNSALFTLGTVEEPAVISSVTIDGTPYTTANESGFSDNDLESFGIVATGKIIPGESDGESAKKEYVSTVSFKLNDTTSSEVSLNGYAAIVYPKTSASTNYIKLETSAYTNEEGVNGVFNLKVTDFRNPDNTATYPVSLYSNAVDNYGTACYIENLNNMDVPFVIEVLDNSLIEPSSSSKTLTIGSTASPYSVSLGKRVSDPASDAEDANVMNAAYLLGEQQKYRIEYFAMCGWQDQSIVSKLVSNAASNKWFCPFDAPIDYTNKNMVKQYFDGINENGITPTADDENNAATQTMAVAPFHSNTSLCGKKVYLATSTLYWERVMTNMAMGEEFAPVHSENWGVLNANPVVLFKKSQREELLNALKPINTVSYNERRNVYFLNDNRTHQKGFNVLTEENNRRMINKVYRDLKYAMEQFKAELNTASTRSNVSKMIEEYFNANVMNKKFRPVEFQVKCDKENNTDAVINANKLAVTVKIRLQGSIKFIEVLNDVYPLGVSFEQNNQ